MPFGENGINPCSTQPSHPRERGFGLAEMMIAVSLISLTMAAAVSMMKEINEGVMKARTINALDEIDSLIRRPLLTEPQLLRNTLLAGRPVAQGGTTILAGNVALSNCMSSLVAANAASCTVPRAEIALAHPRVRNRFVAGPSSGAEAVYYSTLGASCRGTSCPEAQFPLQALAAVTVQWTTVPELRFEYCLRRRNTNRLPQLAFGPTVMAAADIQTQFPACANFSSAGAGAPLRPSASQFSPAFVPFEGRFECAVGQGVTGVNNDGSLQCGNIVQRGNTCTNPGEHVVGFNADGSPICDTIVNRVECPTGQGITGYDTNGTPICRNIIERTACGAGQAIQGYDASGNRVCTGSIANAGHANGADEAFRAKGLSASLRQQDYNWQNSGSDTGEIYDYDLCWVTNCESYNGPDEDFDCQIFRIGNRHWQYHLRSSKFGVHCIGWYDD